MSDDLLKLAERCEREGPSYDLDCKIEHLCDPRRARILSNAKPYTASLDAAVALVPEGWEWTYSNHTNRGRTINIQLWNDADASSFPSAYSEKAKTFPLGVCAASLRARHALWKASLQEATAQAKPKRAIIYSQ